MSVDINEWYEKLAPFDPNHFRWTYFREPDLDYKMTSIAIYANDFPPIIQRKLKRENLLKRELQQ